MQNATPNTTRTEFADIDGDTMQVGQTDAQGHFSISMQGPYVTLHADQAPAVALAILIAAGWPGDYPGGVSHQILADLGRVVEITGQAAAKAELTKRRDQLAAKLFDLPVYEFHPGTFDYADSTEVVRNAIDMIIQLQDEATK